MAKRFFLTLINSYQSFISVFLGGNCRFYPSCSEYSKEAFTQHVWWKAIFLTSKRVLRCHPLGAEGYDPVPCARTLNE